MQLQERKSCYNQVDEITGGGDTKMNAKMKDCFQPHVLMHSLFGLGLGILLATWFEGLRMLWLGLGLIVVAVVLDVMRK